MRPIKFRLRIGDEIVGYERWNTSNLLERKNRWVYSKDSNPEFPKQWSIISIPHTDKDQFTGQRDSETGEEIYEGDTVRNQDGEEVLIGKVVWDVDAFIVRLPKQMEVDEGVNANFVQLGYKDWEIIDKNLLEEKP